MADPATFLASHSFQGTLFSSESSLFIQLWKILCHYLINIVIVTITFLFSFVGVDKHMLHVYMPPQTTQL